MSAQIRITGAGLQLTSGTTLPELLAALLTKVPVPALGIRPEVVPGYRGQDQPTASAMFAAETAVGSLHSTEEAPSTGVIVASTTSNLDSIIRVAAGVAKTSYRAVLPPDILAIAGSQVVAALSSWFGARAFAYGTCTGNAAGLDALALAASALRRCRADRVLVVGTEAAGEATTRMIAEAEGVRPLFSGAAAVTVERFDSRSERKSPTVLVGPVVSAETVEEVAAKVTTTGARVGLVFVPAGTDAQRHSAADWLANRFPTAQIVDLWAVVGDAQGALGVLQCALAVSWTADNPEQSVLVFAGSINDRHLVAAELVPWRES